MVDPARERIGYNVRAAWHGLRASDIERVSNMKKLVALVVVSLLGVGGWYSYGTYWAVPEKPQYTTDKITRGNIVQTVSATGTVEPLVKVIVGSQVSGTCIKWFADFNAAVKRDFVLAQLDPDRYKRSLDQKTAAVAMSKAGAEQMRVRYEDAKRKRVRLEGLMNTASAAEDELLNAKALEADLLAGWHAAEAQILASEADKRAAEVDLDRTIIRSPIDGVVISRDIDEGQTVAASLQAPTLFTIAADLKKMQVHANVSETDIGQVREGMPATFTVDTYPGRTFKGRVSQVRFNPTVVTDVVTYTALVDVENEDLALRPGITATIAFEVARADDALVVPSAALRFKPGAGLGVRPGGGRPQGRGDASKAGGGPTVYRMEKGQPVPLTVHVGLSDGSRTQVNGDALKEGMEIVVEQKLAMARPSDPARAMQSFR